MQEEAVQKRYAAAAQSKESALCCPVEYNARYLDAIPEEVLEKDYGCGDPSRFLKPGETVLDLGSGAGKICFIASQVVGSAGRVIGVDMTDDMLDVARRNAPLVAAKLGFANVEFKKGRIQDLALDLDRLDQELKIRPAHDGNSWIENERRIQELRAASPLIGPGSIDVVVSNCVLNLVDPSAKQDLFREILRVLKTGGRAVISDIVSNRETPEDMRRDPELWSGCISGAFTEQGFIEAFENSGFHGIEILERQEQSWRVVEGVEYRSMTVQAFKPAPADSSPQSAATVAYRGPLKAISLDDGRTFERGRWTGVDKWTMETLLREPLKNHFVVVSNSDEAIPDDPGSASHSKRNFRLTPAPTDCCSPATNGKCC